MCVIDMKENENFITPLFSKPIHKKISIFLADITYINSFTSPMITIPLNIGYIMAFAEKHFKDHFEFKLFKDPKKLIKEIHQAPPDILGLSCYYWNMQFDVYAADIAKKTNPDVIVVAGGPQIDFKHKDMAFKEQQFLLMWHLVTN